MAASVVVAGACAISVGTGADSALEVLGYSVDGVQIAENGFFDDVPGDQNGGTAGPPIDVQYFGEIHRIRLELSKWDAAIAAKIFPKLRGGTAGSIGVAGTLVAGNSKSYRLLLKAATTVNGPVGFVRNYLLAIPRGNPIEMNVGTRFSRLVMDFECHATSGDLWNVTDT